MCFTIRPPSLLQQGVVPDEGDHIVRPPPHREGIVHFPALEPHPCLPRLHLRVPNPGPQTTGQKGLYRAHIPLPDYD